MTARDHKDHEENVGAYALNALPELEARVFERHLMGCSSCQDELGRLQTAAEALPRAVTPYSAPASLKASLMAAINEEVARTSPSSERRSWLDLLPSLPRMRPAMAWVSAAFLLGAGAVGGYAVSQLGEEGSSRTLGAQVDRARLPKTSASLLVPDNDGRGAVLRVHGAPDPGADRVYQVWIERDGEVVPVSSFNVDARGTGAGAIPEDLGDVDSVMVTREDSGGGALAPTEDPVVTVKV